MGRKMNRKRENEEEKEEERKRITMEETKLCVKLSSLKYMVAKKALRNMLIMERREKAGSDNRIFQWHGDK